MGTLCRELCKKTAEPIEMQFGMLSGVAPGNMYYMEIDAPTGRDAFGMSGQLKNVVQYRILRVGKGRVVQKASGQILTVYTSCDVFLRRELLFGVAMIEPGLTFLMASIFRSTPPSRPNNIRGGNVRPSVGTSVRPSTKSLSDFNEIWYAHRGR